MTDTAAGSVQIHQGDNLEIMRKLRDGAFTLVYLDPPFNTGRTQSKAVVTARAQSNGVVTARAQSTGVVTARARFGIQSGSAAAESDSAVFRAPGAAAPPPGLNPERETGETEEPDVRPGEVRRGFHGRDYERLRGDLRAYDDRFDDYWGFLEPRLAEAWRLLAEDGTLYLHLDYREAHYAKVLMDALFGRDHFLNELIWAYDYGAKSRRRWPTKHDTILVYVKDPQRYWFDAEAVDREPYMAPGLVTPEKAARGKLPTDVWWHTIVPTAGREKTGYPTQKPEGILRRIVQASSRPGDAVLDPFGGSGTTAAVAAALGRSAVVIDANPEAVAIMRARMPTAEVVKGRADS